MSGENVGEMAVTKKGASLYLVFGVDEKVAAREVAFNLKVITSKGKESYSPQFVAMGALDQ